MIAHLGNGSSLVAVRTVESIDTTMGFTPTGGVVMGTRSGDLDPGVVVHLLREHGLPSGRARGARRPARRACRRSPAGPPDMRALLSERARRPDARADSRSTSSATGCARPVGALAAALGGLDMLVFTGGIGEHAAPVRAQVCAASSSSRRRARSTSGTTAGDPIISRNGSPCAVRVVGTDEDAVIARHVQQLLGDASG